MIPPVDGQWWFDGQIGLVGFDGGGGVDGGVDWVQLGGDAIGLVAGGWSVVVVVVRLACSGSCSLIGV
ncbi:unnamed protein product [Prunus armeniaca]|uniref:Uncharacterized protein n=1 Tax=Prunus armeniaca TaxID=36596 RepID=A0A6J5UZR5_PRUAR|nr:unnamed protein product [Prunus armeniaca]